MDTESTEQLAYGNKLIKKIHACFSGAQFDNTLNTVCININEQKRLIYAKTDNSIKWIIMIY